MYPRRWLTVLAVAAFLLGLLWGMPARLLLSVLDPVRAGVSVEEVSGTLARGGVRARRGGEPIVASWELQPWRLLMLQFSAGWTLDMAGATAEGRLALAPWGRSLEVARADIPAATLNRWTRRWRGTLDQPLAVRGLAVALTPGGAVRRAEGQAAWGPGGLQVAGRPGVLAIPALRGRLARTDSGLEFVVDGEQAPGQVLARATYDAGSGELHAALLQRGADLLGVRARSGRDPETPVFELRQLLRGQRGGVDLSPAGR